MLPAWSQEINSPWFGCIHTSFTISGQIRGSVYKCVSQEEAIQKHTRGQIVVVSMRSITPTYDIKVSMNGSYPPSPYKAQTYLRSQIFIVPSSLPVTTHFPSLWNITAVTFPVCPSNVCIYPVHKNVNGTLQLGKDKEHTGVFERFEISQMLTFLCMAAAKRRLLGEVMKRYV